MRGLLNGVARGAPILALLGAATASCASTKDVTPWFRVEHRRPVLDQPFLVGQAEHDVAWMRVDGRWVRVAEGDTFATGARDGKTVLFLDRGRWKLAREGGEIAPLGASCAFPSFHPMRPVIYCASCATGPDGRECLGTLVAELDLAGRVTREWTSPEPASPGAGWVTPVGVLPDGALVISTFRDCRLFAVGADASRVLASRARGRDCDSFPSWAGVLEPLGAEPLVRPRSFRR